MQERLWKPELLTPTSFASISQYNDELKEAAPILAYRTTLYSFPSPFYRSVLKDPPPPYLIFPDGENQIISPTGSLKSAHLSEGIPNNEKFNQILLESIGTVPARPKNYADPHLFVSLNLKLRKRKGRILIHLFCTDPSIQPFICVNSLGYILPKLHSLTPISPDALFAPSPHVPRSLPKSVKQHLFENCEVDPSLHHLFSKKEHH